MAGLWVPAHYYQPVKDNNIYFERIFPYPYNTTAMRVDVLTKRNSCFHLFHVIVEGKEIDTKGGFRLYINVFFPLSKSDFCLIVSTYKRVLQSA